MPNWHPNRKASRNPMTSLRGVRKHWGVRKSCCELLGRLLPSLFPYTRTELKSFPTLNSLPGSFIPGPHPRNASLGRLSHQLILSFYFGTALGFFISFPHSCSRYLSLMQTNNRLGRNTDWILGLSTSDNDAQIIYWSLQFHLREWIMFFCLWVLPPPPLQDVQGEKPPHSSLYPWLLGTKIST